RTAAEHNTVRRARGAMNTGSRGVGPAFVRCRPLAWEGVMALNVLVIVGSVRGDRIGIRPARYLQQLCASRGHQATLIDPVEYRLPLLDRMYKEYPAGQAPEQLERLAIQV